MQRTIATVALGLWLAGATSAWAQFDVVFGARGTPTQGTITKMSPNEVSIDRGGREETFQVNEIRKITFSDDPIELQQARDAALEGRHEDAIRAVDRVDMNSIAREIVKQDALYYKAYSSAKLALAGGGDPAAAATLLLNFAGQNRGSYHFHECAELLGDLAAAMGQYDKAVQYYGSLARAPWPDYKLRSDVLVARSLQMQGNFPAALAKYKEVMDSPLSDPNAARQKLLARVGSAKCLAETGKPQDAIREIEDIIAKNDPKDATLFARAYNALGDAHRQLNQPQDALLAYLHVDTLFFGDGEAHAEALYHLADLWSQVNQNDRSVRARSLLKSRYTGSPWAQRG